MDKFSIELLEKVNGFYATSFSQLMTITLGLVAFVGVLIPILFTFYHNRKVKLESELLQKHIEQKVLDAQAELMKHITQEVCSKFDSANSENDKRLHVLSAGLFHLQANFQIKNKSFKNATDSSFSAIFSCIEAHDELNLKRGLEVLMKRCLPFLTPEHAVNLKELDFNLSELIAALKGINENGRYTDTIFELSVAKHELLHKLSTHHEANA